MSFSEKHIQNAFDMILGTVQYGNYMYLGSSVSMRGQSSGKLTISLNPMAGADRDALANDLLQIKANLKRLCFEFYSKSAVLLTPYAVIAGAQAEEA